MDSSQLGTLGFHTVGLGVAGWANSPFGCGECFTGVAEKDLEAPGFVIYPCVPLSSQMLWAQSGNCRRLLWPDPLWGLAGTGPLLVMLSQDLFGWGLPGEQSVAARLLPLLMFLEALSQRAR